MENMKDNALVSVIMPCYNVAEYIQETIESVLNQDYNNLEIIIINDGSTDETEIKIKKFLSLENIIYIKQNNKGVSYSRNLGIELSKGDYITFIDGDDLYYKEKISSQLRDIKLNNSKISYCRTELRRLNSNEKISKINRFNKSGKILIDYIIQNAYITTNDWLIEKDLIKSNNIKFEENIKYGEDFNFFMKVLTISEVVCTDKVLTVYRVNDKSSSYRKDIRDIGEKNYISEYIQWVKSNNGIYRGNEINKIIEVLDNFLLPLVILKNIDFNNKKNISIYEKKVLKKFKFNLKNIKTSIKYLILLVKFNINIIN